MKEVLVSCGGKNPPLKKRQSSFKVDLAEWISPQVFISSILNKKDCRQKEFYLNVKQSCFRAGGWNGFIYTLEEKLKH
jgi:hypothetical protein